MADDRKSCIVWLKLQKSTDKHMYVARRPNTHHPKPDSEVSTKSKESAQCNQCQNSCTHERCRLVSINKVPPTHQNNLSPPASNTRLRFQMKPKKSSKNRNLTVISNHKHTHTQLLNPDNTVERQAQEMLISKHP
jgi:hypothetical protein